MRTITQKPAARSTPWLRLAVLAVAACAVFVAFMFWWFGVRSTTTESRTTTTTSAPAVNAPPGRGALAVSERGLDTLASLGRAIYWAGPQPNDTLELTQHPDGRIYLRYLPPGMQIGSPRLALSVASYPMINAYSVTRNVAKQPGSVQVPVKGGVAFYTSDLPTNVYVAYRGSSYQIQVFDPSPARARELVTSGSVQPVQAVATSATVPRTAVVAVHPVQLAKLAQRLDRPIYWAVPDRAAKYELTQTPGGRVYVRYLPPGAPGGSAQPYLTVGTYPLANAYATTQSAAKRPGSVPIDVPGGVAFYSTSHPTSVYVAYPGVNEQIEVYDPSAARAHEVVAVHRIRAVS